MEDWMVQKGVPSDRISRIEMWSESLVSAESAQGGVALRTGWGIGERFVIEYSGNFGVGHDESTIFAAMRRLKHDDGLRWVFIGGGTKRADLERVVAQEGIGNVILKPYQPRSKLADTLAIGDVHLVLIAQGFQGLLVPSKFYGALSAGKPVLYIGPTTSEVARVICEENCGMAVRQGDVESLCESIRRFREDGSQTRAFAKRASELANTRYSMVRSCGAWHRLLIQVCRGGVSSELSKSHAA